MRRLDRLPTRKRRYLVPAAASAACLAAVISGCSAGSPATGPTPAATVTTAPASSPPGTSAPSSSAPASSVPASADPATSPAAAPSFTVTGVNPVLANGSQDTNAQAAGSVCEKTQLAADRSLGAEIATGFALDDFPVASALLTHFLTGEGTEVAYPAGSAIARQARASSAFRAVDSQVQQAILGQLTAGTTRVRLSAGQLPTVSFESESSDLYWGFRGTQGLSISGHGSLVNGRWTGTLSYVIRDSYGFPVGDTLAGFGPPMRYLQTVCGAPEHPGGARWFPDSITVTVPFSRPA